MTRPFQLGLGLALLSSVAFGCAAPTADEADATEDAITGGREDATLAKSVGQLFVQQANADGSVGKSNYCTATVLGPRAVLAAASCFGFSKWAWQQSRAFETRGVFMLGPRLRLANLASATENVARIEIIVPTELESASDSEIIDGSVAVVHLMSDVADAEPIALGSPVAKGAPVTLWGYGCDGNNTYGVLRSRELGWGAWNGWFGTSFSCTPGDRGAAVVDKATQLVGISTKDDSVLAIDATLRAAIETKLR